MQQLRRSARIFFNFDANIFFVVRRARTDESFFRRCDFVEITESMVLTVSLSTY